MSSDPYCPEIHNASDTDDSDYEVESVSSSDEEIQKKADKIQKMIKEEIDKQVQPVKNYKDSKEYKKLVEDFPSLNDEEKINRFAIFLNRNGGIDVNNIIELKQLVILIGATEHLEGFKDFPRAECYKMLEMMTYHTNKHLEILDV